MPPSCALLAGKQTASPLLAAARRRFARPALTPRLLRRPLACFSERDEERAESHAEGESSSSSPSRWLLDAVTSPLVYVTVGIAVGVRVVGAEDSVQSVVALSALPVVGLSILARTPAGQQLQSGLASSAPQRAAAKAATAEARAAARARLADLYGPTRALLVAPPPEHLDGSLPADLGFDPLGLGTGRVAAMRTYELLHARWAMLGAVGAIVPEALTRAGVELGGESVWWRVGAAKLAGETINWGGVEGFHIAGAQGVAVIAACQLVLMGGPEYARQVGIDSLEPVGVPLPGDADYPGGSPFDPLGLANDPEMFERQRCYELHVGRAAMVAFSGFAAQAAATGAGPLENLLDRSG